MLKAITICTITVSSVFLSCLNGDTTTNPQPSFGIYLTKLNIEPSSLISQSYIEPASDPVISLQDISRYSWTSHTLYLTESGRRKLDSMAVPVNGISFVACVNRSPRYAGAFWTPFSSRSFSGPTIIFISPVPDSIRIGLGYPVDSDTANPDPRNDSDIKAALEAAGKL